MARCDEGYLCEVCGLAVEELEDSDLCLRYILGEISSAQLMSAPERHLHCNPVLAQFITAEGFPAVTCEGLFDKHQLDPEEVARRETEVTRGYVRLQEVRTLGIPIAQYPLRFASS